MKTSPLNNFSGQMVTEMVLLITVFVGIMMMVSVQFRNSGYLKTIVEKPWNTVAGMIECGIWLPADDRSIRTMHPNHWERHVSFIGDKNQ